MQEVPFFVPWISDEDKKAVLNALESRWLTGGPKTREFENLFAQYVGVNHAVAVNSCTAALHLAMRALDIGSGDEVIVPDFTFAATANAALFVGARPVFADVDERTFNISPGEIEEKITKKTKAVVVVHYGGQPCDMKQITDIAERHDIRVIEDCAHSLGATYEGKQTGTFGEIGCFSFYPTKVITTIEGGMATTNDKNIAERIQLLREHGVTKGAFSREKEASWYYDVKDLGYNYRLTEIQSALGISQLNRIDRINDKRIKAARDYTEKLSRIEGVVTPFEAAKRTHAYHLYVIRVQKGKLGIDRDALFKKLADKGIGTSVHYTPLHLLTLYREKLGYRDKDFPVAGRLYKEVLSLPLFPTISEAQVRYVTQEIANAKDES